MSVGKTTVPQSLKNTWIALAIATFAVVVSGLFIIKSFASHVFVPCRGTLKSVSATELNDHGRLTKSTSSDLDIHYDEVKSTGKTWAPTKYKNVRVVWNRSDSTCSCSDVAVKWDTSSSYSSPYSLRIYRDDDTGLYTVRDPNGSQDLAVFRKIDDNGHRFQSDRVLDPHNISLLVFLLSLGALSVAGFRAFSAAPYATRMHTWTPATLRHDGLIESESGAAIATMEARSRVPAGAVIVDPSALDGSAYRAMPVLTRRNVGAGNHARWFEGTMRRLRDARSLSVIATMTTIFALIARVIA